MKKILALAVGLMMVASASLGADPGDSPSGFYLGLGADVDAPGAHYPSRWPVGKGGELYGDFMFDRNIGLELDFDHSFSSLSGTSNSNGEYTLNFKYLFDGNGLRLYLLGGPGFNLLTASTTVGNTTYSANRTCFDFDLGVGAQSDLGNQLYLYVEGKYNGVVNGGGFLSDFPILAGLNFKL
jgi:opacity protein-like surface antigen